MLTKADLVAAAKPYVDRVRPNMISDYPGGPKRHMGLGNANVGECAEGAVYAILRMIIAKSDSPEAVAEIERVLEGRAAFIPVATDAAGDAFADASKAQAFPCAPLD